ncbi:transcription-repair coupling factor [Solitalea koreensis]|uniref:Transcription-repair-coupling factor n=1 Tax=Solitalea koreensis TaxID=543615 RepID=A0A521AX38_9SPHI|nr:transcription-repair coupling factor [Solitalea koreensis]SMO39423.1 transcription-repair coupling factor [Solitalea koreensis]
MQTIQEILALYEQDTRIQQVASSLQLMQQRIHLKGLVGSSDAMVALALQSESERSFVYVLPTYEEAVYFLNDLENIGKKTGLLFPASYKKSFEFINNDPGNVLLRAEVLNEIKSKTTPSQTIVTYPEALAEKVISRETLEKNTLNISVGDKLSIDFINEFLIDYSFERVDFVYEAGQFSVRGGIVDIFSFSHELPYRVEFFGDEVESIRTFETEDQLSVAKMQFITIIPNVQSKLLTDNNTSFLDYISEDSILWFKDVNFTYEIIEKGVKKAKEIYKGLTADDKIMHPEWLDPIYLFEEAKDTRRNVDRFSVIEFGKQFTYEPTEIFNFEIRPQPSFNKDFTLLQHNLNENTNENINNFIFADSAKQVERLYAIFNDLPKEKSVQTSDNVGFTPINLSIHEGFIDKELKMACYTDHQIFDRYYKYKPKKNYSQSQALTLKELRDLKPGDFVTHIDHGIGKYAGLEKIEVSGHVQETIRLVYADNDLLYVNINSLNRISKYTGKDGTQPKLSKLGTDAWEKLKKNTKKKVKDIARDLIALYAKRKAKDGYAFMPDTYLQNELEASFIYEDTPDQIRATSDFKKDMEAPHPMDRLVCGDVGFGKTEVAVRAAFKAVTDSKQVAVLVPTTILASQHYRTFKERLKDFPCTIDYINRFKSAKQIKESLKKLEEGKVDIIIGTHRIVSKDVKFHDLGLLIIDEEQKFGVTVKEKLKSMRVNVDTLTLTATPIPRTLHFSLMGARDLSIISTPPPNRQPVVTELHVFNEKIIKEAIEYEVDRGGQVFFIHNRVKDILEIAGLIRKLCKDVKVTVAHGQMEGDELEDRMSEFVEGKFDVLVATTIIEAGLDISNANTILINQAHNFGLSDLHQMRGRVGRSNKKAFCYLLSPPLSVLTPEARKRLSAIEEFSDLGSGFNVAMRDLDIRGAGNLLGAEQSGFVAEIGYEMYHKILDEAIQELKEEEFSELFKDEKPRPFITYTQIDTDLEILIPDEYVSSTAERYNLYTELSKLNNETQLEAFAKQLVDRFGPMPKQVKELLNTMRLQWLAKEIGFEKLSLKSNTLRGSFISNQQSLYYESVHFTKVLNYVQTHQRNCRMKEGKQSLALIIDNVQSITHAIETLSEIAELQTV